MDILNISWVRHTLYKNNDGEITSKRDRFTSYDALIIIIRELQSTVGKKICKLMLKLKIKMLEEEYVNKTTDVGIQSNDADNIERRESENNSE